MAFLCPVSPGESDRCSYQTWKPLVMCVSLDHPWWWPEERIKLCPLLWHGNSLEFQHFYDTFGNVNNHFEVEVNSCSFLPLANLSWAFQKCFFDIDYICHSAFCYPFCIWGYLQIFAILFMPQVFHLTPKVDIYVGHIFLQMVQFGKNICFQSSAPIRSSDAKPKIQILWIPELFWRVIVPHGDFLSMSDVQYINLCQSVKIT